MKKTYMFRTSPKTAIGRPFSQSVVVQAKDEEGAKTKINKYYGERGIYLNNMIVFDKSLKRFIRNLKSLKRRCFFFEDGQIYDTMSVEVSEGLVLFRNH